jgi:flagellar hook-associated protein 3 FlgL
MISGSLAIGADWFLNGISSLQRQELKTQQQLSSGYKIQDASDSPSQTPELIGLGSSLASLQSYQTNLGRVQAETTAADNAIGASVTLLDQARGLAVQGASSTSTAADRQNLAVQVHSIQQQLVAIANTTVEGRYIFGGGSDQTPPYQFDATSATGVDSLTSPTVGRVITDPAGQTIFQPLTASAIFDTKNSGGAAASDNTFAALQNLQSSLQANNTPGIAGALTSLESASTWVNQQQASYGVAGSRVIGEQNDTASRITALNARISEIRDTDVAAAASDLARETTAQTAAFGAQAEIPRKSLFDYLG